MLRIQAEVEIQLEFRRSLNWIQLLAIGLGAIIGAGIFVLSGHAASKYAGPSVIISFILTGIVTLFSALSFSELGAMMPLAGSVYTYTYASLGEYLAWFVGWNSGLLYLFGVLTVSVTLVQAPLGWNESAEEFYITGQAINLPAIALTTGITIILIIGVRETAMVNLVLVVFKIIVLLIFIFACCKYVDTKNYKPFFPTNLGSFSEYGFTGMLQASTYVFFAYVGFDAVTTAAQEVKAPETSLPIALIGSTVISLLLYVGVCTVMVGLVPYKLLNLDNPLSEAIKATPYVKWLPIIMSLGAIAGYTTVGMMIMLSQTRVLYAMAHDGLLPQIFCKLHRTRITPWISTLICGIFCAIFSGVCPIDILGETTTVGALSTYIFAHISVVIMRYTHKDMPRAFKIPCGTWLIPTVGSLLCMLLMKSVSKATAFRFLAWTLLGQIFYFSYGYRHSRRARLRSDESNHSSVVLAANEENNVPLDVLDVENTTQRGVVNEQNTIQNVIIDDGFQTDSTSTETEV